MEKMYFCREILTEGVNGIVEVKVGECASITFPGREAFDRLPEPVHVLAISDAVEQVDDGDWYIKPGALAEIMVMMDATWTQEKTDDWLKENGGWRDSDGWVHTFTPLPDRYLSYSLAIVDSEGKISPSPEADSPYNWPARMQIRESITWE